MSRIATGDTLAEALNRSRELFPDRPVMSDDGFSQAAQRSFEVLGGPAPTISQRSREELETLERQAIEQAREDELFQQAREVEIQGGRISTQPVTRFNQIRRELGLPDAEDIPPELVADTSDRAVNASKLAIRDWLETTNREVQGVGDMVDAMTEVIGIDFEAPVEYFEAGRNVLRAFLPDDPRLREEFLASQLPSGLGSTVAFFAAGAFGPAGPVVAGAALGAQEQAETARRAAVTGRRKAVAIGLGTALGTTESAVPLRLLKVLKPIDRAVKGKFFSAIMNRGGLPADVAIETVQEVGQQLGSNIIAKHVLEIDRDLTEGLVESGEVGAGVGAIYGGLFRLAGVKLRKFESPQAQAGAEQGADVAGQVKAVEAGTAAPPAPAAQELKANAPGWLRGKLLDDWANGRISDEEVINEKLGKFVRKEKPEPLDVEEEPDGSRTLRVPEVDGQASATNRFHLDALNDIAEGARTELETAREEAGFAAAPAPAPAEVARETSAQARVQPTEQVLPPGPTVPDEARQAFRALRRRGLGVQAAARQARADFGLPAEITDAAIAGRPESQPPPSVRAPGERGAPVAESQVDPPGVAPGEVENMGMPGVTPPPGREGSIVGEIPMRLERPTGVEATVSAPEVIDALAAIPLAFGRTVPVRVGRLGSRDRGIFKVQPEVVRIRTANDIRSASHEVGHAVDHLTVDGQFDPKIAKELQQLGKALYGDEVPTAGYQREGFAELVFLWVTQPKVAQKRAPKAVAWFEQTFLPKHSQAQAAFNTAREAALRWAEQGALARVEQSIVDVGSLRERLRGAGRAVKRAFSAKSHIEALQPLNLFARQVEAITGKKLSAAENPFIFAQSVRLAHDARLGYMVEHGMVDASGNRVGGSLNEAFAPVRDQWQKFVVYLYAKRAQALWNDPNHEGGRNPGISLQDADKVVRDLETPDFELAAKKVYDWNDGILNYAAGLSPTFAVAVARIKAADPGYYVPLQREMDQLDAFSGGQASVGAGTLAKRLRGSGRRIQHPVTRMVANADRVLLAAHRRYVMDQVIRLSQNAGLGHLVEKVPREMVPVLQREIGEVVQTVNRELAEADRLEVSDAVNETVTFFAPETQPPKGLPIIPYKNVDKLEFYQVDPELFDSLMGLDHFSLRNIPVFGSTMEWVFAKPRRVFVTGTTGLRMSFGLVTNPQRDLPTMYLNSRANANGFQMFFSWWRSMASVLDPRGPAADPYYDAYLRLGVQSGQILAQDIKRARRATRRVTQGPVRRILDVRTPFEAIQGLIQRVETGPRLAELRRIADDVGWRPGTPMTLDQATQMLIAAKQVTTDFSSSGTVSRAANQIIPFYNAAIQGPRANVRALQRNPRKFATRGAIALTVPTLLQWWFHKDEDWYKELPWREKYLFWYIPVGNDTLLRIPRAFEIGLIFASMPEAFIDAWYRDDPEAVKEWFSTAYATLIPDLLPVLPREALAQASNWDRFWERPVVSRRLEGKPPEEQFAPFTSKAAIMLGKMFKVSPVRIDHAIRGVGGGVASDLVETLGLGPVALGRESEAADIPVIGRMFRRGGKLGSRALSINKVYDALDEAYRLQASDRIEETASLRNKRLMLEDAARAISNLMVVRSLEPSNDRRNVLFKEALSLAQEALRAIETGEVHSRKFQRRRTQTERGRTQALRVFEESQR